MIEDLNFVIEKAKAGLETEDSKVTLGLLEAIRNATYTKVEVLQRLEGVKTLSSE